MFEQVINGNKAADFGCVYTDGKQSLFISYEEASPETEYTVGFYGKPLDYRDFNEITGLLQKKEG